MFGLRSSFVHKKSCCACCSCGWKKSSLLRKRKGIRRKPVVKIKPASRKKSGSKSEKKDSSRGRPEDETEHFVAPRLGKSHASVRGLVRELSLPLFEVGVLRIAKEGLPTEERMEEAKSRCLKLLANPENRKAVEKAFKLATKEPHLDFDFESAMKRVEKSKLSLGHRSDFRDAMALTLDHPGYPILLDGGFPLTTKAMVSLLFHEALHCFVTRRGRPGNPRLSEDTEHVAMMLLGDKDMARARH